MKKQEKKPPYLYGASIPEQHWDDLEKSDVETICNRTLAIPHPPEGLTIDVFHESILVNIRQRRLQCKTDDSIRTIDCPLFELMTLVHLISASHEFPTKQMISVGELKDANFFQGVHSLRTGPVLKRYGRDADGFKQAAKKLNAEPMDMADASFKFSPFPKIPIYYLLREGDDEFGPNLSILFDKSIESHLNADGILGSVGLITELIANNLSLREL